MSNNRVLLQRPRKAALRPRGGATWLLLASALLLAGVSLSSGQAAAAAAVLQLPPQTTPAGRASASAAALDLAPDASRTAELVGVNRSRPALGELSAPWAPLVLSTCTDGMPPHYAPCLAEAEDGVAYGEELVSTARTRLAGPRPACRPPSMPLINLLLGSARPGRVRAGCVRSA
jgi:hypothetical protein